MPSASASRAAPDVIVVGGGVIGLSVAEELARRGRRVEVFERRRPGGEASWAAAGMIAPDAEESTGPFLALAVRSREMWRDYAARLRAEYATDVKLREEGALLPAADEAALARLRARRFAGRVEWLDARTAREKEPALPGSIAGAAWLRDDLVCENRALLFALLRGLRKLGVTVRPESPASVRVEDGTVRGVVAGGERVDAGFVINAAGAWAGALFAGALHPPLHPVRGQMLGFRAERGDALRHVVHWDGGYAVPRGDGRIVVGSTMEPEAGFTKGVTPEALDRLESGFRAALPGLAAERRHAWSGLRPAAADGLPILGALPGVSGYLLATGHYRNGILLTPVTAAALADLAEGKRPAFPLDAFAPDRAALARPASIVVNGTARTLLPGTTVGGLLGSLALRRQGVAVAVNEEVVCRGDWDRTLLGADDRVEIIHAVGGG